MHGLDNNPLIYVKADIESTIALAGVRALGLIDVHITRPLWKFLDNREISVTGMSVLQKLHDTIDKLVHDASPIMNENFQFFFITALQKNNSLVFLNCMSSIMIMRSWMY